MVSAFLLELCTESLKNLLAQISIDMYVSLKTFTIKNKFNQLLFLQPQLLLINIFFGYITKFKCGLVICRLGLEVDRQYIGTNSKFTPTCTEKYFCTTAQRNAVLNVVAKKSDCFVLWHVDTVKAGRAPMLNHQQRICLIPSRIHRIDPIYLHSE